MNRPTIITTCLAGLVLLLASCAGEDPQGSSAPSASPTPEELERPAPDVAQVSADDYHRDRFDATSSDVAHALYPLRPGTHFEYIGSSLEDGERLRHRVDIVVTDFTKVIDGVEAAVIWERDYTEGELVEAELAMFAQDTDGHVWHFGQYPEEYEEGEIAASPAWLHGYKGATAGILIPANPEVGTRDYAQGFAPPPLNWVDRGRVYRAGQRTCVPAGCYDGVVVIEEFETGLPDAFQDKHYAPDVGVVRVGWRGSKDDSKEVLKLVEVSQLDDAAMDEARREAVALERSAYERSTDVFALTDRMTGP